MNIYLVLLGVVMSCLAEALVWWQISAGNLFPYFKDKFWPLLITSPAVTYFYWKAANILYTQTGTFWSVRVVSFATGTIVFSLLTYMYFNVPLSPKTAIIIFLSIAIICIQIYL